MVLDGQLEAALVTKPVPSDGLFIKPICEEQIYICLRRDDPLSELDALPQEIIGDRLKVMFARAHHPWLYDKLVRKLGKVNIGLKPSEFASSPSEIHFLVGRGQSFGIVLESTDLPPNLVKRSVTGVSLKIGTAFICLEQVMFGKVNHHLPLTGFSSNRNDLQAIASNSQHGLLGNKVELRLAGSFGKQIRLAGARSVDEAIQDRLIKVQRVNGDALGNELADAGDGAKNLKW